MKQTFVCHGLTPPVNIKINLHLCRFHCRRICTQTSQTPSPLAEEVLHVPANTGPADFPKPIPFPVSVIYLTPIFQASLEWALIPWALTSVQKEQKALFTSVLEKNWGREHLCWLDSQWRTDWSVLLTSNIEQNQHQWFSITFKIKLQKWSLWTRSFYFKSFTKALRGN